MSALATPHPIEPLATAHQHHSSGNLRSAAESYRRALNLDPQAQPALLGLSLIARQSNQHQAALRMAVAALMTNPRNAIAWANCADTLAALNQMAFAENAYRRAIALDDSITAAYFGLGNLLAFQEDFTAALANYQPALELTPNLPELHFAIAFIYGKLGRHADAVVAYRRAVTLRPGFAAAWLNLGVELIADGRDYIAEPCYRQALAALTSGNPVHSSTCVSAHINLGHLARSRRQFVQAHEHYTEALTAASTGPMQIRLVEVHLAFASLHIDQRQYPEARQSLHLAEQAQAASTSHNSEIPNTRGILLLTEHNAISDTESYIQSVEQAIESFREAESQGHKTAASNLGNALLRLGRCEEALAAQQAALVRSPYHHGVRYNLALTQLRLGDFANGWPIYEIRWSFREVHPRPRRFRHPRWNNEPLGPSSRLFLYAEQGLGDTIQFIRYLNLVTQRLPSKGLVVEVQSPLVRLLIPFIAHLNATTGLPIQLIARGEPIPPVTHHCPLMSLPAIFHTTLETIPAQIPYLFIPSSTIKGFVSHTSTLTLHTGSSAPAIGINWAGNPGYRADYERSTHLRNFLPLLQIPNIRWISLQKGAPAGQLAEIPPEIRPQDAASGDRDLADAAATIASLDLVITTDTAIAHLAGALGKPLWLLLPWQSDWRWMQDRLDTPWYPTARLFRQSSPGNWTELIHRVAAELTRALQAPSAALLPQTEAVPNAL